jgi:16S rRNA (uracil1498-N3)-methyltransferase
VTPPLFLVEALTPGDELLLGGDEGRHAARVRRLTVGEAVLVADGAGTVAECTVAEVLPDALRLAVLRRRFEPAAVTRLVVVQALPKGDRAELAVEVLTELGADEIVPWAASRSVVQWHGARGDKALAKWRRTAREAAKQSRRARVPEVAALASTEQVADRLARGCGLVLHEDATARIADVPLEDAGELVVVVGPEGGLAAAELDAFRAAGAVPVRLGAQVLRTSTAGAAALAALSVRLGRWG